MGIFQQATLTNLRSLPYGHDTVGGGDSGEPYIITPIPPAEGPLPNTGPLLDLSYAGTGPIINGINLSAFGYDLGIDGGLMRGGFSGALLASKTDFVRIGKFLKDAPKGPLFLIKQVGLQLSNPQPEAPRGIGALLNNLSQGNISTLLFGADNLGFSANIGGTRIYNGVNTLLEVPINAFGGHITRHGLLPIQFDAQQYASIAFENNRADEGENNNLVRLKNKLEKHPNANIASYISGPGSVYGIGTTTIHRFDKTLDNKQYLPKDVVLELTPEGRVKGNKENGGKIQYEIITSSSLNYYNAQGVSLQYFDNNTYQIEVNNNVVFSDDPNSSHTTAGNQFELNAIKYSAEGKTYAALREAIETQSANNTLGTVAQIIKIEDNNKFTTFIPSGSSVYYNGRTKKRLDLSTQNIETRLGLSGASGHNSVSSDIDTVNYTPLYYAENTLNTYAIINNKSHRIRDLIKFRIEAVDNDHPTKSVWMVFRAYLKDITDTPNPSWGTVNYVGRGEPFYIYKGFERNVSFTLQVAAMSEAELKPMWQKLNYLYSNTMPDYKGGVMRSPYMKLTLGDYFFRQPGVIKNMTYTIGNDSPWEIAIDEPETGGNAYELPHVMTIQITFAPIHNFLPRKFPQEYNSPDWQGLPAFMGNRVSNQNQWLTDIFDAKHNIPDATFNAADPNK